MIALMKKELRSYLYSVVGALFIAANLLFMGIYFTGYNLTAGYPSVSYTMSSAVTVFLFITPLLTMGIMSQELRLKTDRLLYTSPMPVIKIVLGKYLAMLCVFLVPVLVSCIYPLILSLFGKVNYGESYMAILAYFLFGAAALSIGLFISSFTENQIIAAVLTFAALFITFLMGAVKTIVSAEGNILTRVMSWFDMGKRIDNFMNGLFDIRALVYYLSICALLVFLTYENVQRKRYSVSVKNIRFSAYSISAVIVSIAVVFGLNYLVLYLPDDVMQYDLTENKLFTISGESKEYLDTLDKDVDIFYMTEEDYADEVVKHTLEEYKSYSRHIKVKYVDITKNPQFASAYTDEEVLSGDLLVVCGGRAKVINNAGLYETQMDYQTFSQNVSGYDGEGQITSAIAYVTNENATTVRFVTGHGEFSLSELSMLKSALKKANLQTEELSLLTVDSIEDTDILFIAAPTSDYTKEEAKKVSDYLKNGGKAIIATQYSETKEEFTNLYGVLKEYGISVSDGLIVEPDAGGYYGNNPMYILPKVQSSSMTGSVYDGRRYVFTPYAQAIILDEELPEGVNVEDALRTSDASYVKANMEGSETLEKTADDKEGPFDIGAFITDGDTKIALITSGMALTDDANSIVGNANTLMITDAVNAMSDGGIKTPVIPVKSMSVEYITVSRAFVILYSLVFSIAVPLLILAAGIVLWARRRRR